MGYKLWLDNYDEVITFHRHQTGKYYKECRECKPLQFRSRGELKDDFSIKEIDSLTCSFKDEEDFMNHLKEHGNNYVDKYSRDHLLLTHLYRDYIKKSEILYNNNLLKYYGITSRGQQQLNDTDGLNDFIKYIKSIALNETTSNYLLNPYQIGDEVTPEDKMELNNSFPNDIYSLDQDGSINKKTVIKPSIITLLKSYKKTIESLDNGIDSNIEINEELTYLNNKIHQYFTENYQNLRRMFIWEAKYKSILEKGLELEKNEARKMVLQSQLEHVNAQQDYRNGIDDRRDTARIVTIEEAEAVIDLQNKTLIKHAPFGNDAMLDLYNRGGIEAVMENMDADEIYGNMDDAKALGIIPPDTPPQGNYKK